MYFIITHTKAMQWNGAFASMLFINHWEYTRDVTFLRNVTYPLLSGLMDWWACTLTLDPTTNLYVDYPDDAAEGQQVPNPQMALAFIARIADVLIGTADIVGIPPDPKVVEISEHLSPFNTNGMVIGCDQTGRVEDTIKFHTYACLLLHREVEAITHKGWFAFSGSNVLRCPFQQLIYTKGTVWTNYRDAAPAQSNMWSMYPMWSVLT
jgi:hypothetical protein